MLIKITSQVANGLHLENALLADRNKYCQVRISDNGLGFEQRCAEQVLELCRKLNTTDDKTL